VRSVRATRNGLLVTTFVGTFAVGCLAAAAYDALAFLVFPFVLVISYLASRIRCPNCETPVGWHTYRVLGATFEWWSALTPKRCEHCGYDLTRREGDSKR
jgi:DNA-directed RNA polymerase subunit RPC12/RpoP